MRISDWSSDVCSSDLCSGHGALANARYVSGDGFSEPKALMSRDHFLTPRLVPLRVECGETPPTGVRGPHFAWVMPREIGRASCRERVVSTCRSRWVP